VASAAAALETIRLIEGGLLEKAEQLSLCLMERLKTIPVGTASGFGLVWTFALPGQLSARRVVEQCRESGLLLRLLSADSFGIRPPLVVTEAEIDRAVSILRQFLVRDGDSA
jgi:adenosylmethionine-8-amino-7-oxononanoate aminotransferase